MKSKITDYVEKIFVIRMKAHFALGFHDIGKLIEKHSTSPFLNVVSIVIIIKA